MLNGLHYVEVCCLYIHFAENFFHEWLLNFVKHISSIEIIFIFILFMLCITLNLNMLNYLCIWGMNFTWSWCMILLISSWNECAYILLRTFTFICYFLQHLCLTSVSEKCVPHKMSLNVSLPLWHLGSVWKDFCLFFFRYSVIFTSEVIWFWALLCWEDFHFWSISLVVTGLFRFSIFSWFSLHRFNVLRNLSISSWFSNKLVCNYS